METGLIEEYFPALTAEQAGQLKLLCSLLGEWNEKINVISRRDIQNVEERHVLHSLSIAKFVQLPPGARVLDFGCGGGLPGLPLAVMFPGAQFHLIDRVGKKIRVATEIASALGLKNVSLQHGDIAECRFMADYVVSRAVMPLEPLMKLSARLLRGKHTAILPIPPGLITLKGGDISDELGPYASSTLIVPLSDYFPALPYFATKLLTYTPAR